MKEKRVGGNYNDYYMTTREIADIMGISKQRVCQILESAIKKLRSHPRLQEVY